MRPDYLTEHQGIGGRKIVEIDTRKVRYKGKPYHQLDGWEKKKLDNAEFLKSQKRDMVPTKIIYR